MSDSLINKELILLDLEASDRSNLLKQMAGILFEKGYVKDSYSQAIVEREELFSTGLPGAGGGVAIPHTDAPHVNQSAILVGILKEPVTFQMMGNHEEKIPVNICFMLALKESNVHIQVLSSLMELIQDEDLMKQILETASVSELYELLIENMEAERRSHY